MTAPAMMRQRPWRRVIDDVATAGGVIGLVILLDAWFTILVGG